MAKYLFFKVPLGNTGRFSHLSSLHHTSVAKSLFIVTFMYNVAQGSHFDSKWESAVRDSILGGWGVDSSLPEKFNKIT